MLRTRPPRILESKRMYAMIDNRQWVLINVPAPTKANTTRNACVRARTHEREKDQKGRNVKVETTMDVCATKRDYVFPLF